MGKRSLVEGEPKGTGAALSGFPGFALCLPHYNCAAYALDNIDVALKSVGVTEIVVVDDASSNPEWDALREGIQQRSSRSLPRDPGGTQGAVEATTEIFVLAKEGGMEITLRLVRFRENRGPFFNKSRCIGLTLSPWALLLDPDNVVNVQLFDYLVRRPKAASRLYLPSGHFRFAADLRPKAKIFPRLFSLRSWNFSEVAYLLAVAGRSMQGELRYLLNTGNFVCDVAFYKNLNLEPGRDPGSSDVITLVRLWLDAGGTLITDRKFKYWHRLRSSSHWSRLGDVAEINAAVHDFMAPSRIQRHLPAMRRGALRLFALSSSLLGYTRGTLNQIRMSLDFVLRPQRKPMP